jgi:dTDP-4-amino-4,6-dideoxygalactose transaminase
MTSSNRTLKNIPVLQVSHERTDERLPRITFLPFVQPHITPAEIDEVVDTLHAGCLMSGPKTRLFEREFAARVNASHALAVNSAMAALHLALDAIGLQPTDEVIVPVYTFTATAAVVVHMRARPVFVDVDPLSSNLDPAQVRKHITPRARAIIVTHMAGLPTEMDEIMECARKHDLAVIEDAASAFPAAYKGRMIGSIGDLTAFGFDVANTLAIGAGGMLTTTNPEYAARAAIMSRHGIERDPEQSADAENAWRYEVVHAGYEYGMSELAASLGLQQLARSAWLHERRRTIAQRYTQAFDQYPEVETPPDPDHVEHAWQRYILHLNLEALTIGRDEFIQELMKARIGTGVHCIPLHMHPFYRKTYGLSADDFPCAQRAYERAISLPVYPGMDDEDVEDVIAAVECIIKEHKR